MKKDERLVVTTNVNSLSEIRSRIGVDGRLEEPAEGIDQTYGFSVNVFPKLGCAQKIYGLLASMPNVTIIPVNFRVSSSSLSR